MGRHGTTFDQRLRMDEEHQQLAAVDGLLYPDENGLGGCWREGGVDEKLKTNSSRPSVGYGKLGFSSYVSVETIRFFKEVHKGA